MAYVDLLDEVAPDDLTEILAAYLTIRTKLPFLLNLMVKERQRLRKMGIKFEGYVKENTEAAGNFPTAIPAAYPLVNLKKKQSLWDVLTVIYNEHSSVGETLDDTRLLLGSQMMGYADVYYSSLKNAAKGNVTMAEALEKISGIFDRNPPTQPTEYNIPAGGIVIVENVATGTKLVNKGDGVVKYKASSSVPSKVNEPAHTVNPNSSDTIPKGWTSIEIQNLSQTNETTVLVRIR